MIGDEEFEIAVVARVGDVLTDALQQFVVLGPPDDTPELRCEKCLTCICDVEYQDTLAVLVSTAFAHLKECPA